MKSTFKKPITTERNNIEINRMYFLEAFGLLNHKMFGFVIQLLLCT